MYRRKAKENCELGGHHYLDHRKLKFAQDPLLHCRINRNRIFRRNHEMPVLNDWQGRDQVLFLAVKSSFYCCMTGQG